MASPSIASYFNVRKRAAADEIVNARNKILRLDSVESSNEAQPTIDRNILAKNREVDADTKCFSGSNAKKITDAPQTTVAKTSERRTTKRIAKRSTRDSAKETLNQPKIVKFTLGGTLSPRKKTKGSPIFQTVDKNSIENPKTPIKLSQNQMPGKSNDSKNANVVSKLLVNTKKELSFDDIKSKVTRSAKLEELKAILNKHQQLNEQYKSCINKRSSQSATNSGEGKGLKQFDTIELEVLTRLVSFFFFFF